MSRAKEIEKAARAVWASSRAIYGRNVEEVPLALLDALGAALALPDLTANNGDPQVGVVSHVHEDGSAEVELNATGRFLYGENTRVVIESPGKYHSRCGEKDKSDSNPKASL